MNGLIGDVALVTGGARGIGRACVEALAEAGAFVYSADVKEHDPPKGAESVILDVSDSVAVNKLVERASRPIQVLVNNAGIYRARAGLEIADDEWQRTFDVIAGGTFYCTRAVAGRLLREAKAGAIVSIASIAGKRGFPDQADYCAAKSAVLGFTRAAALDLATRDITVNAINPGTVATPMIEAVIRDTAAQSGRTEDAVRAQIVGQVPIARMQTPEEIAAGVVFLASKAARGITGETLAIDGGQTRD